MATEKRIRHLPWGVMYRPAPKRFCRAAIPSVGSKLTAEHEPTRVG